jgi:hypothetical protein
MRKSLIILLAVELLLAVALGQIGTLRRPELDRAYTEWHQHPTVQTRELLERQERTTELVRWGFSGVVFAVLAGATIFVYWLRRGEQDAAPNGGPARQAASSGVTAGPPSVS